MLDDILNQLGILDTYLKHREELYVAKQLNRAVHDKDLEAELADWVLAQIRARKSNGPETTMFRLEEVDKAGQILDLQAQVAEQGKQIKGYEGTIEQLQQEAKTTGEKDVATMMNVLRSVYHYHAAVSANGGKQFEERLKQALPNDLIVGRIRDFVQIAPAAPLPIDDETRLQMLTMWTELCAFVVAENAQMAARAETQESTLTIQSAKAGEKTNEVRKAYDSLEDTLVGLLYLGKKRDELDEQVRTTRRKTRTSKLSADDLDWRRGMMLNYITENLAKLQQNINKDKAEWQTKESAHNVKIAELEQKLKRGGVGAAQAALLQDQINELEADIAKARQDQGLWVLDTVKQIYTGYSRMVLKKPGEVQDKEVKNPLVSSFLNRAQQAASPEAWQTVITYLFPSAGQEFDPALAEKAADDKLAAIAREEVEAITDKLYRSFVAVERANAQQNTDRRKHAAELKERDEKLVAAQEEIGKLAAAGEELARVEEHNSTLTLEYHAEKELRKQADAEVIQLRETLKTVNEEYGKLSTSLESTTQLHRTESGEKARLAEQLAAEKAAENKLTAHITALEQRVSALSDSLAKSQDREKSLETQKAEVEKRFAGQRDYAKKTEEDLSDARGEIATHKAAYDDKQRAYAALESRAVVLEGDLKFANEQNALLQQNIESAERNYQKLVQENTAIEQESERRNRLLHDNAYAAVAQKKEHETRVTDYETLLAEARGEVSDAERREAALREAIKEQLAENSAVVGRERDNVEAKLKDVASREKQLDLARVGLETREKQLYATVDTRLQEYKRFIAIGKELVKLNNQKKEQAERENGILRGMMRELKPESTQSNYTGGF